MAVEIPLNDSQREMVAGSMGLVLSFVRKNRCPFGMDRDDFVGAMLLAITRAACSFDPARGAWTTYAFLFMKTERSRITKLATASKRMQPPGSFSILGRHEGFSNEPAGVGCCPVTACVQAEASEVVGSALRVIDPHYRLAAELSMEGLTTRQMAVAMGISQTAARKHLRKSHEAIRRAIADKRSA